MNAGLRVQHAGEELAEGGGDGGTQESEEQGLQPPSRAWAVRPARYLPPTRDTAGRRGAGGVGLEEEEEER